MMKRRIPMLLTFLAVLLLSGCASKDHAMEVIDPWGRPTAKGGSSNIFFQLRNHGAEDQLTSVRCTDAGEATIQMMQVSSGVAEMVRLEAVRIPQGKSFDFEPGGAHVLLENVKRNLNRGDTIALTLVFEEGEEITVEVSIDDR